MIKIATVSAVFGVFTALASAAPVFAASLTPLTETKITASDAAAYDYFGESVAVSGDIAIVGAWGDDDDGSLSGSAYLFDVSTGDEIAKLTASDAAAYDAFGRSVAVSGDIAIVGAYGNDEGGSASGSAYLFDVTTGDQIAKLTASDAAAYDYFGRSVAISGDTAIVGAWGDDDDGTSSGSAYLFDVSTGDIAKLRAEDAAANDAFGRSVAISGDIAIVGADGDDDGGSGSGSAYLFDVTTGEQIAKLTASDAAAYDTFGTSVAISGDIAIVGALGNNDDGSGSGSAYLFDVTTGEQIAKLTAEDAAAYDNFGYSVAVSGDIAIVGALGDDDDGNRSGSAYLFDVTTGDEIAKLTASDAAAYEYFGASVAASGDTFLVGAYWASNTGSAYIFTPEDVSAVPAVPLPAGGGLLVSALGLLALLRRRRTANA